MARERRVRLEEIRKRLEELAEKLKEHTEEEAKRYKEIADTLKEITKGLREVGRRVEEAVAPAVEFPDPERYRIVHEPISCELGIRIPPEDVGKLARYAPKLPEFWGTPYESVRSARLGWSGKFSTYIDTLLAKAPYFGFWRGDIQYLEAVKDILTRLEDQIDELEALPIAERWDRIARLKAEGRIWEEPYV